jgi:hypothetical protein
MDAALVSAKAEATYFPASQFGIGDLMACIQLADSLAIARYANTMRPVSPAHAALSALHS